MLKEQEVEVVLRRLIREYRLQVSDLSGEEREFIGIWHFEAPCQIVHHWMRPLDWHLIAVVHSPTAPDQLIHSVGPLEYDQIYDAFPKVLDLELWNSPAYFDERPLHGEPVSVPPGKTPTLRDLHKEELSGLFQMLQYYVFRKPHTTGEGQAHRRTAQLSYVEWWGALSELNPPALIRREVSQAKRNYAARAEALTSSAALPTPKPQLREEEKWDGCWTHLYPPLAIGPLKEPSLFDLLSRARLEAFHRPPEEFRESHDGRVVYTAEGFIGIRDKDPRAAARLINLLSFLLTREGKLCHYSSPNDLGLFREPDKRTTFGRFLQMRMPRQEERQSAEPFWRRTDPFGTLMGLRYVEGERFEAILAEAAVLERSDVSAEVVLVHEAHSLLDQRIFTHSLLLSWFAVERLLNRRLRMQLLARGEPEAILKHFAKQPISSVIKVLGETNQGFLPNPAHVNGLKHARDLVAHSSDSVTENQASSCLAEAQRMLATFLEEEKEGQIKAG